MRNAYLRGTYLLGANEENDLVFADIWTRTIGQDDNKIDIGLNVVSPINEKQFDIKYEVEDLMDTLAEDEKYRLCESFDCAPSQLVNSYIAENGTDPRDYLDCSLYPECYEINQDFWYFKNESFGLHSGGFLSYITRPVFDKESIALIYKIQRECESKQLDKDAYDLFCDELDKFIAKYKDFDEEAWIISYIKDEFYS